MGDRLRWARKQAGYGSASEFARELDIPVPTYSSHERAGRGGREFDADTAIRYGRKFKVSAAWLLTGEGDPAKGGNEAPASEVRIANDANLAPVAYAGKTAAGAWREVEDIDQSERRIRYEPADKLYPHARRVFFEVEGDSMNAASPTPIFDGATVTCVDFDDLGGHVPLQSGMKVIVQQERDGGHLREWSIKVVQLFDDRVEFQPRSTNPRHRPIVVPKNMHADEGRSVRVLALVRAIRNDEP